MIRTNCPHWMNRAMVGVMFLACVAAATHARSSALLALAATRDRPLFSPTRRPPPPPPPTVVEAPVFATPTPENPAPIIQLIGIIFGTDDDAVAIIKHNQDATTKILRVGAEIDNWTVEAIRPRELFLASGARTITIQLSAQAAGQKMPGPETLGLPQSGVPGIGK